MSERSSNQPTHAAVALKYDGEQAPTIAATWTEELAQEIVRIARELVSASGARRHAARLPAQGGGAGEKGGDRAVIGF